MYIIIACIVMFHKRGGGGGGGGVHGQPTDPDQQVDNGAHQIE